MRKSNIPWWADKVRTGDPDRFRASLVCSEQTRQAVWALLALNLEVSRTAELVTDERLGHIRLQWWLDRVQDIVEGCPISRSRSALKGEGHNSVDEKNEKSSGAVDSSSAGLFHPLSEAISKYGLPAEDLAALIVARRNELEFSQPATMDNLIKFACEIHLPLSLLICRIEGSEASHSDIERISTSYAMVGFMRSVPYHINHGRFMVPETKLKKEKFFLILNSHLHDAQRFPKPGRWKTPQAVSQPPSNWPEIIKAIQSVISVAEQILCEPYADKPDGAINKGTTCSPYLNALEITAHAYIRRFKKFHYNPFRAELAFPGAGLLFKLWRQF